jgi:hypothetical protein
MLRPFALMVATAPLLSGLFASSSSADAQVQGETDAMLDLVYGHCIETLFGRGLRPGYDRPENWDRATYWMGSETTMNTQKDAVDLRFKQIGTAELMVDLQNKEICWTQFSSPEWRSTAQSVFDFAIGNNGFVVTTSKEPSELGFDSRVTMLRLDRWEGDEQPFVHIRDYPIQYKLPFTVMVLRGTVTRETTADDTAQ